MITYTKAEVYDATLKYFNGDEVATKAWINKSALRNKKEELLELTPDDRLRAISAEVARIENKYSNPLKEEEVYEALEGMKNVVFQGSPVFGIGNPYTYSMLSNCTAIESPVDSISGIMKTASEMANLFKVRAGVGVDISSLRPEGAHVNNSAKSSTGAWSFAELYSHVTQAIGQAGRRGACILLMAIKHPDIYKFTTMKHDLSKVTGANISLKIFDDFMRALQSDEDYILQWPVDSATPSITETIKAKHLWDVIITEALERAEPGIAFWDRHIAYNPSSVYDQLRPFALNPCLTGDALVYVADGRGEIPIRELAEKGEDIPVFCLNEENNIAIRYMRNPRITGYDIPIYKVTLDNGFIIRTTGNHKFLLKTGEYKRVDELKHGDSLIKITKFEASIKEIFKESKAKGQDYWWINNKRSNKGEHRYIAEFGANIELVNGSGLVVHHKDFNAQNNSLSNLEILKTSDHDRLHGDRMKGDNNPMRRMNEWTPEERESYHTNMSKAISGALNGRAKKVTNEEIKQHCLEYTRERGYRLSEKEWSKHCKEIGYPAGAYRGWRKESLGTVESLLRSSATECGFENVDVDPRVLKTQKRLLEKGTDAYIQGGCVWIKRKCELCGQQFHHEYSSVEARYCSQKCGTNHLNDPSPLTKQKRYLTRENFEKKRAEETNEKQMKICSELIFNKEQTGTPFIRKDWEEECKKQGVVFTNIGRTRFGFQSWAELIEASKNYNHKIVSVELDGAEDVYNGTVDDYHNFFTVAGYSETKSKKRKIDFINNKNCGEQALPKDSCRLISYNLKHIADWRQPGSDYHLTASEENRIKKYVRIAVRLADDMVDLEFEKLHNLMDKSWKDNDKDAYYLWKDFLETGKLGRRVGLSIHGLADLIARLGIRYDSDEALDVVGRVFSLIRDTAYETSIQLAKERGAFPLFDWELEKSNEYILNLPEGIKEELKLHGRRNVCLLTCAPAGTVSILSQTSSGIEPVFANEYVRKCRINDADSTEGKKVVIHEDGGKFFEYTVYHKNLEEWKELNPNQPIPDFFVEAGKIDWLKRIQLQGIIQKYVDASISSTLNLVKGTTKETVSQVYMEAWKHGLKGVTVYVDGSREGILNHVEKEETKEEPFGYKEAPKRPEVLECDIHYTQIGKEEWIVLVGLWSGKPYEIFGGHAKDIIIPRKFKKAHIIKRRFKSKNSEYDLYLERATENEMIIKNVSTMFENKTYGVLGRLISLGLRHGCSPVYVSEQLFKDTDFDFMAYNKVMGRILKKYIVDGEKSSDKCQECGATLIYESGCAICRSCGFSKCN